MNKQIILKTTIAKSIKNGWLPPASLWDDDITKKNIIFEVLEGSNDVVFGSDVVGRIWKSSEAIDIARLIYSHDFAKSLWGFNQVGLYDNDKWYNIQEDEDTPMMCPVSILENWQYHLQQMVISDDPIEYLGENMLDKSTIEL